MKLLNTYKHEGYERLKIEHPFNTRKEFFYWFGAKPFIRGLVESFVLPNYASRERP